MALINCPECGRQVSSSAAACPDCGYPVVTGTPPTPPTAVSAPPKERWWKIAIPLVARVFIGLMLLGIGLGEEEPTGVIGGLIIGGSALPAWYRNKMARFRAGRVARGLDDQLEDRLADMEQQHREQMAQVQRAHTEQIADLEERIDFTERLLTRNREQIGPG